MTIYNYKKPDDVEPSKYAWRDRHGNILNVPDDSWDPILDNPKCHELQKYLIDNQYDGPGDWNPL